MLTRIRLIAVVVGICLFGVASAASAENWVVVYEDEDSEMEIDLDSIRKGEDALVYYTSTIDYGIFSDFDSAVDCQKHLLYFDLLETKKVHGANWRSQGEEVVSGSVGAYEVDLVCSRAR